MARKEQGQHIGPYLALRITTGLSQREAERRLGWTRRGRLSQIERGLFPTTDEAHQLRTFYALLVTNTDATLG